MAGPAQKGEQVMSETERDQSRWLARLESDCRILKSQIVLLEKMIEGNKHLDDARFKALAERVLDLEKRP
jgi:hypothetical protein